MHSRVNAVLIVVLLTIVTGVEAAPGEVVALVNGEPISRAEFGLELVRVLGQAAIEGFVDRALVEQEARGKGLQVTQAELAVRRELEVALGLRAQMAKVRMSPREFRASVQRRGLDVADLRRELDRAISPGALRANLLAEKLLAPEIQLGEDRLRDYYERTRGPHYAVAHLMLRSRREAEQLLGVLRNKPDLWRQAVLEKSLDRASVPYMGRVGPVPAESSLGKALAGMRPGEMRLYTDGSSWRVLHLIEAIPAEAEFEQVKQQLSAELLVVRAREKFDIFLAELNENTCVTVNLSPDPRVRRLLNEQVAVFVNGEPLTVADLAEALVEEFGRAMLDPYVERVLIRQEADRRGVAVSGEELSARMRAIAEQLFEEGGYREGMRSGEPAAGPFAEEDIDDFKGRLVRQFADPEDVRAALLAEKIVAGAVEVTDEEVLEAYRELCSEGILVRELTLGTAAAAQRVLRRIERGASFDMLAQTMARGAGTWIERRPVINVSPDHPYYPYVKDIKDGEVSGAFKHDGGYHIIKVLKRRSPSDAPPLESVRESLHGGVFLRKARQRIRALLVKLKAESELEVRL